MPNFLRSSGQSCPHWGAGMLDNYLSIIIFLPINSFKMPSKRSSFQKEKHSGGIVPSVARGEPNKPGGHPFPVSKFFWVKLVRPSVPFWGVSFCSKCHYSVWGRGGWGVAPESLPRDQVDTCTW